MTESDNHHFAAHVKVASISEEFSGECFDFDRLSASCLQGLVRGCFSFTRRKWGFGGSSNWVWKKFNLSKFSFGEGNGRKLPA